MASFYDLQDDKALHKALFQLTDASNGYTAEILYGRSDGPWENLRGELIDRITSILAHLNVTAEEIQAAVDMEFGDPTAIAWVREHVK